MIKAKQQRLAKYILALMVTVQTVLTPQFALATETAKLELQGERLELAIFKAYVAAKLIEGRVQAINFPLPKEIELTFWERHYGGGGLEAYIGSEADSSSRSSGGFAGVTGGIALMSVAIGEMFPAKNLISGVIVLTAGLAMSGAGINSSIEGSFQGQNAMNEVKARLEGIETSQKVTESIQNQISPLCDLFLLTQPECATVIEKTHAGLVEQITADIKDTNYSSSSQHPKFGDSAKRLNTLYKNGTYPINLSKLYEDLLSQLDDGRKKALAVVIKSLPLTKEKADHSALNTSELLALDIAHAETVKEDLSAAFDRALSSASTSAPLSDAEMTMVRNAIGELTRNLQIAKLMHINTDDNLGNQEKDLH